ncbi:hypothetical protein GY45DRAFT_1321705 [Cubamyces sp. BRFM 1775]|nr:hypothetical protein GY45DRAFT_1321705 [Cubamyces sp. BRFM 1775]
MYSSRPTYNSPPPELSNNPFIDHSANALARFPDISATGDLSPAPSQYTSWLNRPQGSTLSPNQTGYYSQGVGVASPAGYNAGGYQPQPQPQPQLSGWAPAGPSYSQQQQQQPYGQMMSPPAQPQMSSGPFQPSSAFGQQLAGQINGAYGAPLQQAQQPQYSGYAQYGGGQGYQQGYPQQQQQQQQQQYLAEFDPYAQQQAIQSQGAMAGSGGPSGQYGQRQQQQQPHPREFVVSHKAELESWDPYTWKQAQNCFDALKAAWEARKQELEARLRALGGAGLFNGGMYGGGPAQQYAQLDNMAKEAGLHVGEYGRGGVVPDAGGLHGIPPVERRCVQAESARGDQRRAQQSPGLAPAAHVLAPPSARLTTTTKWLGSRALDSSEGRHGGGLSVIIGGVYA